MTRLNFVTFHVQVPPTQGVPQTAEAHLHPQLIDLMFRSALHFHPDALTTVLTDRDTDLSSVHTPFTRSEHLIHPRTLMRTCPAGTQRASSRGTLSGGGCGRLRPC